MGKRADGLRLRTAERKQVEMMTAALDDLLPHDHFVRLVWKFIDEKLDVSRLYDGVRAVAGEAGRDATDPKILLCLWVVALSEGVGSARKLTQLTERDVVYRWICGGVTVNRDLVARFRVERAAEIDTLLTQTIGVLMHAGVVTLNTVAQDGMRVRASAGAASFRREKTLRACVEAAVEQLERLRVDLEETGDSATTRQHAARERAAEEKLAAMQEALDELPAVIAAKNAQPNKTRAKKSEPRVSTTDKDARVMKMADGGFRPAYNPQFTTDVGSGVIVGVTVTNAGTDVKELETMFTDLLSRTRTVPSRWLVDGGYVSDANIEALTGVDVEVLAPVRLPRKRNYDPYEVQPGESEAVGAWRTRMGTDEAKTAYKDRAATAERANAELRDMGLRQLAVRGIAKVTSSVLLAALAFNIGRAIVLLA
jgi:transposase